MDRKKQKPRERDVFSSTSFKSDLSATSGCTEGGQFENIA